MCVAGKHQCRALAESMLPLSEGLKEINHQLFTGVAQELIHYCNSLGQGTSDRRPFCLTWSPLPSLAFTDMLVAFCFSDGDMDYLLDSAIVHSSEPSPLSSSQESSEDAHSPKDSHAQSSKDSPSPKESSSSPRDPCSGEVHAD